jgi:hypothetical protein
MKAKSVLLSVLVMCTLSMTSFSSATSAHSNLSTQILTDYEYGDFQDPNSGDIYAVYVDTITGDITRIELMYGSDLVQSFAGSYVWSNSGQKYIQADITYVSQNTLNDQLPLAFY